MDNGTRTRTLRIVLVIAIAAGWLVGCKKPAPPPEPTPVPTAAPSPSPAPTPRVTPPGPYPLAQSWRLTVGPDPCDVTQGGKPVPVAAIKRGRDSIQYLSAHGVELSEIIFLGDPMPFKSVVPAGPGRWSLTCKKFCNTGPSEKDVPYHTYYKTIQVLEGKPPCDAGIIIEP
jgi:hypothetical protein